MVGATTALARAQDGVRKSIVLEGIQLIKYAAEVSASPQQDNGIWASINEAQTTSISDDFFARPPHSAGVYWNKQFDEQFHVHPNIVEIQNLNIRLRCHYGEPNL